jgi:hypothetical protein
MAALPTSLRRRARQMARNVRHVVSRVARRTPALRRIRALALDRRRQSVFERIFEENRWRGVESRSGIGSTLENTAIVRSELLEVIDLYRIRSMLDIPCGDFHWMRHVPLELDYIGADIVGALIDQNTERYGDERRTFVRLDLVRDRLPNVDLVLCRDGLVHLSLDEAVRAVANIKRSESTYLLATTSNRSLVNTEITTGQWRMLNLTLPPFGFPVPIRSIDEAPPGTAFAEKQLGLWRIADLP